MSRDKIDFTCKYEGPLTSDQLTEVMAHCPDQVHWAPGQDGITGHWFEVTGTLTADEVQNVGAFYVRADSPEAAQQHATVVVQRFVEVIRKQLLEQGGTT
jgi:hypothetical protein